ncbi:hypothetical protein FB554_2227 [Barrientosiimonas humi]|uniref:Capsular polysaccharide synthesis protein n=1 Tax=Barrientosiimonas humi TaxID=999931 RepID=A0A542XE08_9MICO|nr:hypothetical protein [Barrientosiimonas humi]TQL34069.1 hypothetical protein FB554_2227 [Barrientosiimonas humi]CAG7574059.1 hypothetical protein BH39T_PBIAJDOK_02702 [Barrientosiimonas humi]
MRDRARAPLASSKHAAQQLKHRAFLAYKPYRFRVAGAVEPVFRAAHKLRPYRLDPDDWPGTHLPHHEPLTRRTDEALPRRIFVFWTGDNAVSAQRQRGIESLRALNPGLDVVLITPENLNAYLLPTHPLHPSYDSLSFIHRADYLKSYFMQFHGGGYADIKPARNSWEPVFDRMDDSEQWMAGYRVPVRLMTPNDPNPRLEKVMRRCSEVRLGQCSYIARPDTPLTREWWVELNHRMDRYADQLALHPGNARGDNPGYPVPFNALLAQVVDPLQVKYRDALLYDERLFPDHDNYQ